MILIVGLHTEIYFGSLVATSKTEHGGLASVVMSDVLF